MKGKFILVLVLVQIFLMVNFPTATSYSINESNKLFEKQKGIEEKENNLEESILGGLGFLASFFTIKQIGFVGAADTGVSSKWGGNNSVTSEHSISNVSWNCCPVTYEGAVCQDVASNLVSDSCENPIPTKCEEVAECKTGCCFDPKEGLCTTNAPLEACESDGGVWEEDAACITNECQRGCCVLGANADFVTDKRCEFISGLLGYEKDFRDYQTELDCLALKEGQAWGACIIGGGCKFVAESECVKTGGDFNEGLLCSSPSLETSCERQVSVGCYEGWDEIYWFDSCGNRENIYSADKDFSWNEGRVLSKSESCNPGDSNANSAECGNCNFMLGSKCEKGSVLGNSVKDGDYICSDLSCVDEKGIQRKNGESWCVYDGFIGDGKDTVGSRHWKRMCINGEVKAEPCADYRGQICAEVEVEIGDESFSSGSCVINDALTCIAEYNDKENMKELCENNAHCVLKEIDVDEGFKFDVCSSAYPKGFDMRGESSDAAKQLCGTASMECVVVYEKKLSGNWECIFNCDCETDKFTEQMNDFCVSLGDCGSYVNYFGKGTDSYDVENAPEVSWEDYIEYSHPVEGQKGAYRNNSDLEQIFGDGFEVNSTQGYVSAEGCRLLDLVGKISGGAGIVVSMIGWAAPSLVATSSLTPAGQGVVAVQSIATVLFGPEVGAGSGALAEGVAGATDIALTQTTPTLLGNIGASASAFSLGMTASFVLTKLFGLQGDAALVMSVAGAIAGGYLAYMAWGAENVVFGCFDPATCLIVLAILVVMAIVLKILGIGETKEVIVEFECEPWQPPTGGSDCERCNGDPLKPCTEYRCESLGAACELLGTNSLNPICVSSKNDGKPPRITPGDVGYGFDFKNEKDDSVEIRLDSGECIPEFSTVFYGLETDEPAQCKLDYERKSYEEMGESFLEQTYYSYNHTNSFMMPSLDYLASEYNISINGTIRESFGSFKMNVRCQDAHGNKNEKDYVVDICVQTGEDITPAIITASFPGHESTIPYGITETSSTVYLNEPAECKYSFEENKTYEVMEGSMDCYTGLTEVAGFGWPCNTTLTGLDGIQNNVYIKCKDQPWLVGTVNESKRNVNTEDFVYTLFTSESELRIDSIKPEGVLEEGYEPVSVNLEVSTSGGGYGGVSECMYSFTGYDKMSRFLDTNSVKHKQNFNMLLRGDYTLFVKCKDAAGNEALGETTFFVEVDSEPPKIIRAYNQNGKLKLVSDENAECFYSLERCYFDINNATDMTTALSREHYAEWEEGKTYYVKCRDVWGNSNPGCAIEIKSSGFN